MILPDTRSPACPGVFVQSCTSDIIVLLAVIPETAAAGGQVSSMHLLIGETIEPDEQNYWLLQVGTIEQGTFNVAAEISLSGGLTSSVCREASFLDPVLLERGDRLAVRLTSRGAPPPLLGLSIVPEWGVLASRRSGNG